MVSRVKRRHLSRAGVVLLLLVLVVLSGLATGFPFYYRTAYVLSITVGGAYWWGAIALRGLDVYITRQSWRGQVGEVFSIEAVVVNGVASSKAPIELAIHTNLSGLVPGEVLSLEGLDSQMWTGYVRPQQRGAFTLGPFALTSRDPLGLFNHQRFFGRSHEVLVYPRTVPLPHFRLSEEGMAQDGAARRVSLQAGTSAAGVRQYTPGDMLNRIHWPSTARHGRLMVKQLDSDSTDDLWLLLDLNSVVQAGRGPESTEEYMITTAASIAKHFLSKNRAVGLLGFGQAPLRVLSQRGADHLAQILETLARVQTDGATSMAEVLKRIDRRGLGSGNLVIITPDTSAGWAEALKAASSSWGRTTCVVVDRSSFGASPSSGTATATPADTGIQSYVIAQGQPIPEALAPHDVARHRSRIRPGG